MKASKGSQSNFLRFTIHSQIRYQGSMGYAGRDLLSRGSQAVCLCEFTNFLFITCFIFLRFVFLSKRKVTRVWKQVAPIFFQFVYLGEVSKQNLWDLCNFVIKTFRTKVPKCNEKSISIFSKVLFFSEIRREVKWYTSRKICLQSGISSWGQIILDRNIFLTISVLQECFSIKKVRKSRLRKFKSPKSSF